MALSSTTVFAGHGDWRLPTVDELSTLLDDAYVPQIDPVVFPATVSGRYWSSTEYTSDATYAWYVFFGGGFASANSKSISANVRMVRSPDAGTAGTQSFEVSAAVGGGATSLSLDLELKVASTDAGTQGSIFLAAKVPLAGTPGAWFLNDGNNWQTLGSGAPAAYYTGVLPASKSIPVLRNTDVTALGGTEIYAGYGSNAEDMLAHGRVKLGYTLPSVSSGDIAYVQGDLLGQDSFFAQVGEATAKTMGALMQAILAVNSVLYTDPAVSHVDTFNERKAAADSALAILEKHALATETVLAASRGTAFAREVQRGLAPAEVLVTVASGPVTGQLKTLMGKYGVGAREAKTILDNAMAGLVSEYDQTANFYDKAARTAQLVKDGSGLALTVVGGLATAGGATGALTLGDAAVTLIGGVDGVVKVTRSGMELLTGTNITIPGGTVGSAVLTTLSDVSELIAISDLKKWGDLSAKIPNVVNIVLKTNDALQDGVINLGDHTFSIMPLAKPVAAAITDKLNPPQDTIPSTMTGKYRIAGRSMEVTEQPQAIKDVIARLPESDRLAEIVSKPPSTGSTGDLTLVAINAFVYRLTILERQQSGGYCRPTSTLPIQGSYVLTEDTSQGGTNWGYIVNLGGGNFTASCTSQSKCPRKLLCEGSLSGDRQNHRLAMSCNFAGSGSFMVTGSNGALSLQTSNTWVGEIFSQSAGAYVSCEGLPVTGTVTGSYGIAGN